MNDQTAILTDQIGSIVSENQHLRVKSENDDLTIHLQQQQYSALAATVNGLRDEHAREAHDLRTERDEAVIRFKTIDTLLLQAAQIIMQALRARAGNDVPEILPAIQTPHIEDARLPIVGPN